MLYTAQIKKALNIAYQAHKGQTDKGGVPYIFHPYYVAMMMDTEDEIVTALLHDVVEDTDITIKDLKKEGFNQKVLEALILLNHDKSIEYMDYIRKIKQNPIATKVKLEDLVHNSTIERIEGPTKEDFMRVEKYKKSIEILMDK